jgi:GNAT superfamily N-acetyltransferase
MADTLLHIKRREHMFTVVRITELESDSLHELRAESSREGFRFIERLCEEWASGANRFNAPGEALFVAIANGRAVGICGLNRDPYACDPRIGRVRRLYVAPAQRRHGVGRALLETVVTHARRHFSLLRVRSEAANEFYTTQGFRRVASDEAVTHVLEFGNAA